jgi:DNA-binding response OmpR family regulator
MASDNKRLKHLTNSLDDLNNAKTEFFTHITHEFRTPLTVIKGITEYLKESSGKKHTKEINELEHNTEDLIDMVSQILDLRKLSSSTLKLDLKQSDLLLHLNHIVDSLQFPALQKGISLTLEANTESIVIDLDADKLRSVINNIITNALKYTPKGGKITLSVSLLQDSTAKIEITDTGEGLSNTDLQRAFELFYQAENKLFTKVKGSGIGLHYVKQLIDLMHAEIDIDSKEGEGTRVIIKLPVTHTSKVSEEHFGVVSTPKEEEIIEENRSEKEQLHKILIIEDNPSVQTLLQLQLNKNYDLFFAKNGDQGLKKAFEILPDLIISDIMMPGKDGYQVCSILKQDQRTSHIPIILLTARADQPSKLKGLKVEADAYIKKPFDIQELHLQIHNLINNRRRLQNVYQHFDKNTAPTKHPKEDEFILKFREVILNNIENENFKIDDVCEKLKISRSGLHGKIKALTGLSTANYINKIRTQRAKVLIETKDNNISEIAYMVGITNLPYFSTLYKKEFGISPKEYRESLVSG